MSMPISYCFIVAATKDEDVYQKLLETMKLNIAHGSFSQFPCKCDPPCEAREEEIEILNEKLKKDLAEVQLDSDAEFYRKKYGKL
jgi:hypothetical protein